MKRQHHYLLWIGLALVAWYFRAALLADLAKLFAAAGIAPTSSAPRAANPAATSVTVDNPASTLAEAFYPSNPSTPGPVQHIPQNDPLYIAGLNSSDPFFQNQRIGTQGNILDPLDAQFKEIGGGYGSGGGLSAQAFFRGGPSSGGPGPFRIL